MAELVRDSMLVPHRFFMTRGTRKIFVYLIFNKFPM